MAELDVDMLRNYRRCEVWGLKNHRPEMYGEFYEKMPVAVSCYF